MRVTTPGTHPRELSLVPITGLLVGVVMLATIFAIIVIFDVDDTGGVVLVTLGVAVVFSVPWSFFAVKRMRPDVERAGRAGDADSNEGGHGSRE